MIELPVLDNSGKQVDALSIDESQLGSEVRPALLKQAYVMFHANKRHGSARTKSRGMVEGSTRKLYRQKGTGNSRAGSARSSIRTGGGVTFAKDADTGTWRQRMPRKMRRLANRNALLAKLVDGEVKCVESLDLDTPRTSDMKALLAACGIDRTCLVALSLNQRDAALSARNIEHVRTIRIDQLNAFELLNHRYLVVDRATLESFLDGTAFNADDKTDGRDAA